MSRDVKTNTNKYAITTPPTCIRNNMPRPRFDPAPGLPLTLCVMAGWMVYVCASGDGSVARHVQSLYTHNGVERGMFATQDTISEDGRGGLAR